ncbi:MAG TPA: RluA family pseudouridine synthase [Dictyobacter sp.]|jgi:23S rRNA-/tRNA-specific pseudouridylate synthase|nr:RluA family pseudouridine synthase [Dictyobacter sp.]
MQNPYTHGMEIADISIVYQDHFLFIVNKPAGMVIHPTYMHADGTMWDALLAYAQQQTTDDWHPPELPDDPAWAGAPPAIQVMLRQKRSERLWREGGLLERPCLLHRLDKDTSGIVALARTENARRAIIKQFHDHTIQKRYLAVVRRGSYDWSEPQAPFTVIRQSPTDKTTNHVDIETFLAAAADDEFIFDGPLQRDPLDRRRCIVGPAGQEAMTRVRVVAVAHPYALLEVHPVTGRTHQIRAHLAAFGCAIVGDQAYAPPPIAPAGETLERQFLHALSLTIRSYPDQNIRTFMAPLAPDLMLWLRSTSPMLLEAYQSLMNVERY